MTSLKKALYIGEVNMSTNKELISQLLLERFGKMPESADEKIKQSEHYMEGVKNLIALCGDDPEREGVEETPYRVLKAFLEYTEGYLEDPKEHLEKVFAVHHNEIILVKDIEFYSMCEHHFAPFFGKAHVAYIPNGKITGLSKIGRMVDGYAKRFQVQERLTNQITEAMIEVLNPLGVMVVVEGKHMCMCGRGVKKSDSTTTTTATRGVFADDPMRRMEFLSLMDR